MLVKLRIGVIKLLLLPYFLISVIYWFMVKVIIKVGAKRGVHAISVGGLVEGRWKIRTVFREDMVIRTILLCVDLRNKSCLDLACNVGIWSFKLGQFGIRRALGIDLTQGNILRANVLKRVYNFPHYDFKVRDILRFLHDENEETFDIILLLSILYHLPEETDWTLFFQKLYEINEYCLIIDTRWFDNDEYWFDKTSSQAVIAVEGEILKKWRPTRNEVFTYLKGSGYELVIETNPAVFLRDQQEAYGDGNPYTLDNAADYITDNRSIVIAYKKKSTVPDIGKRLNVKYV